MGFVYQREGRTGWWIRWTDALGRTHAKKTTAATKTEAKRLLAEIERRVERQRLGLEELPQDSTTTLRELVQWWLDHRCGEASRHIEKSRLGRHVLSHRIADLPLARVTPEVIDARLREMANAGLSPGSIEHVRRKLRAIFNASPQSMWRGKNPVVEVEARRIPRRVYHTLAADEVPVVLRHIAPQWRAVMATAIYTGARKGELLALRKCDVDLRQRILVISRSWERDLPKGGQPMVLPIAGPLVPVLAEAMRASPSDLVFPVLRGANRGQMHRRDVDLVGVLRTALKKAGLIIGWNHVCRRCKRHGIEPHTWRHDDGESRTCERCGMRLWPTAVPRPIRWHDLRHTTATLLLRDGVSPAIVQRLLRHSSVTTTTTTYAHLVAADVGAALERLPRLQLVEQLPSSDHGDGRGIETPDLDAETAAKSGV